MGKSSRKVAEATASLPPTKAAKNDKRRAEEAPEGRASSKKQKIETEQVDQNKKKDKKLKKTLNESPGEKKDEGRSSDFEYGFAETPITIPPTKAAAKGKRGGEEATEKQASSKNQIVELEKVGLSKKMVKKLKKTLIECPGKKNDETWCSDLGVEKSGAPKTKPVSASKKKPALNDGSSKSDSDEEVGKSFKSNHKAAIAVSKKKGGSCDSSSESDSGEEVKFAETPITIPPTKAAAKGKRGGEEATEKQASSKNQIVELEKVGLSKKMVKKLKKTLIECPGKKNDETWCSDLGVEKSGAPKTKPVSASKKKPALNDGSSKSDSDEEVGKPVKSNHKAAIVVSKKKGGSSDSSSESDSGEEVKKSGAPKTKPVSASKKKPALSDGSSKSDSDEEVGKPLKSNHKAAIAVSKKKGDSSDSSSESDSGEEVKETGNKRMDSLPDNAKNKDASKISEKELETPAKRNVESGTKRLFVGNLPSEVTKDDLLDFFKMSGEVMEIRFAAKEDGSFRGFGHVEFVTEADARAALRMNGYILLGRPLIIDLARERGSNNPHDGKENGSYRIGAQDPGHYVFVKGFGKSLKEDQIRNSLLEHFGSYGKITRVSIPQDNKTGRSKGFAYVLFNDQASVSKALELSGTELGGYTLTVQEPTPKSGSRDGSFSGGRGRGGRSAGRGGGHDDGGRGRGRGGRGPGASYDSISTTASKGKKTTFD